MKTIEYGAFIQRLENDAIRENRKYCFIIGSGCSESSGFPTGKEMAEQWFREILVSCQEWESCPQDLKSALTDSAYSEESFKKILNMLVNEPHFFYRMLQKPISDPDEKPKFSDLVKLRFMNEVGSSYGILTSWRFDTDDDISSYFNNMNHKCGLKHSAGYSALANLMLKSRHNLVISTNFDTLLQDSINKIRSNEKEIYYDEPIIMSTVDTDIRCMKGGVFHSEEQSSYIFKLHHGLQNVKLLNLPHQTRYLPDKTFTFLDSVFEQYIPIVIGYSGGDIAFMDYLARTDQLKGKELFWLKRNLSDIPYPVRRVLENVGINSCMVQINGFDTSMVEIASVLSSTVNKDGSSGVIQEGTIIESYRQDYMPNMKEDRKVELDQEKSQNEEDSSSDSSSKLDYSYARKLEELKKFTRNRF